MGYLSKDIKFKVFIRIKKLNIQETSSKIKLMVAVSYNLKNQILFMKVILKMVKWMVKEKSLIIMVNFMKEIFKMDCTMVKEYIIGQMDRYLEEHIKKEKNKDSECWLWMEFVMNYVG